MLLMNQLEARWLRWYVAVNYVCPLCTKSFKTEQYLKMHLVIHSNDKPFQCDICSSSFNRKDKLKRHLLIHDPVKRYQCPLRSRTGNFSFRQCSNSCRLQLVACIVFLQVE